MRMKVFDKMKWTKQKKLSQFRAFDKLKKFSKTMDIGGRGINDSVLRERIDYLDIASYHRPYENDSRFALTPYSVTFIANMGNNSATNTDNWSNSIQLYPNPTSTNIYIKGNFCEYIISSFDGKKIFYGHESHINTTLFKPGIYFIKFKYLNKFYNQKIIIR